MLGFMSWLGKCSDLEFWELFGLHRFVVNNFVVHRHEARNRPGAPSIFSAHEEVLLLLMYLHHALVDVHCLKVLGNVQGTLDDKHLTGFMGC